MDRRDSNTAWLWGLAVDNSCWAELAEGRTKMNTGQGPLVTLGRCSGFRTKGDGRRQRHDIRASQLPKATGLHWGSWGQWGTQAGYSQRSC